MINVIQSNLLFSLLARAKGDLPLFSLFLVLINGDGLRCLCNQLCWVHETRHYQKLFPFFNPHQKLQKQILNSWREFYHLAKIIEFLKEKISDVSILYTKSKDLSQIRCLLGTIFFRVLLGAIQGIRTGGLARCTNLFLMLTQRAAPSVNELSDRWHQIFDSLLRVYHKLNKLSFDIIKSPNMDDYIKEWRREELMPFSGWDFSYLKGKMTEEKPPWDYKTLAKDYLSRSKSVLDMGTGGGEIFASLAPFPPHAVAIEGYHPNYLLAKQNLERLGVKVVYVHETNELPFNDGEFDLVLNRHSGINVYEIARILSKGGIFLTQQVDGTSNIDLMRIFGANPQWPDSTLEKNEKKFENAGFTIIEKQNWEGKTVFNTVGTLVYYLKAIPWIVPDFSVNKYLEQLKKLQEKVNRGEELSYSNKRYLIIAEKT